ncbi:MAG: hypothetical protein JWQ35_1970 [Bacteriovoracaceae bacterium]|nr:hypothetical protein [Bacteriovoracaceae bacterium]
MRNFIRLIILALPVLLTVETFAAAVKKSPALSQCGENTMNQSGVCVSNTFISTTPHCDADVSQLFAACPSECPVAMFAISESNPACTPENANEKCLFNVVMTCGARISTIQNNRPTLPFQN